MINKDFQVKKVPFLLNFLGFQNGKKFEEKRNIIKFLVLKNILFMYYFQMDNSIRLYDIQIPLYPLKMKTLFFFKYSTENELKIAPSATT